MAAIVYTFSASGKGSVIRAFEDIETAAAHTARTVQKLDKKMSRVAKSTSKERKLAAKEASTAAITGLTKELKGLKLLAKELKKLSKDEKKRGADAVAASKAAEAAKKKEIAANKALAASNRRTRALTGSARGLRGGTGMLGLGTTVGLFGAMAVGAAGRQAVQLEEAVASLAIKGRRPGQSANIGGLMNRIQATAMANPGVKSLDLTKGMMAFVSKTGDLPGAKKYMNTFATVGSATGTDMEDLGRVMAEMQIKMGIKDPKEMMTGLSMMAVAGKRNRIELSDLAKYLPKMASAMTRFSGRTGFDAVKSLSSMIQIGAQGSGNAAGAATSMERAYANVAQAQHTGKLGKLGVSAFRKGSRSKFRDMEDILSDILYATDNRLTSDATDAQGNKIKRKDRNVALMDIFKQRGIRYTSGFSRKWDQLAAGEDQGGVKRTAVETKKAFDEFIQSLKVGSEAVSEIQQDHAIRQEATGAQLTAAWEKVTAEVSKELLPTLKGLAGNKDVIAGFVTGIKAMTTVIATLALGTTALVEQFAWLASKMDPEGDRNIADDELAASTSGKLAINRNRQAAAKKKWESFSGPRTAEESARHAAEMAALKKEESALGLTMEEALYGRKGHLPGVTDVVKGPDGKFRGLEFAQKTISKSDLKKRLISMGASPSLVDGIITDLGAGSRSEAISESEISRRSKLFGTDQGGLERQFTGAPFSGGFTGDRGTPKQFQNILKMYMSGLNDARTGNYPATGKERYEMGELGEGGGNVPSYTDTEGKETTVKQMSLTVKSGMTVQAGAITIVGNVSIPSTAHPYDSAGPNPGYGEREYGLLPPPR